ncbi:bacitracin synthase 3 [Colletotrichum sojae]|uniref:Bacitracin synthase 3 n=1 Tax=Colletotrichum sojae TaxID=2175907 RepID=A0A8H6N014_9PEZI|nr:bacitracin synthase 3 [Colletotrichum sojae]
MQLVRHIENHEDFFLPNSLDLYKDLQAHSAGKESISSFSEIEAVFPATEIQRDILNEDVQWAEVELFSGNAMSFGLETVFNAWTSLASHHVCLRSYLTTNPKSGEPQVVILRRIERIRWNKAGKKSRPPNDSPAYVSVDGTRHIDGISVILHFHRALIDTTSLHTIKLDYALQLHGLPGIESAGFATYIRYLNRQREGIDASKTFWSNTFSGTVPLSVFGEPSELNDITLTRHGVSAVVTSLELGKLTSLDAYMRRLASWRQTFFEVVWAHVLSAHTVSDEVTFGTVRRDESFIGAETCVGCVDQTYLVRFQVTGDHRPTFLDGIRSLDAYHDEASRHAFIGLNEIQHLAGHRKTVESAVSYSQTTNTPCIAPGLSRFPVVLCISDADALRVTLKCKAYIPLDEVEVILKHFVAGVLRAASILGLESDRPLTSLDLISEDEKQAIISQSTSSLMAEPTTIPKLFEETVASCPNKIAVDFEGTESLTFVELNRRSNGLARKLRLSKGAIFPILMERSLEMVVTILAVLKSGAAYTVLDPDSPVQRLEQIIDDCKATTVLASSKYLRLLSVTVDVQQALSDLDNQGEESPDYIFDNLDRDIATEDLCYVIYTSGSTGKPKGAVLTHRAATSGMGYHSLRDLCRWLLFYNPSFSAAQRTILGTLVHGGTVVLAKKETLTGDLAGVINNLSIDALGITPSALSLIRPDDVPRLRQITLVGERISQELVDTWACLDTLKLRNTYGLSECTQLNFGRELSNSTSGTLNPRVVGTPTDTTGAFILEPGTERLSPILVTGELCLSGPQLSEGYVNNPALTERAFIDNPFGPGKLYRTGDRARRLADGQIEILGRIDMQVKINGQKVEPAEVDRLLFAFNGVDATVTLPIDIEGRPTLVTGVVVAAGHTFRSSVTAARDHLKEHLPAYMLPGLWLPLDEIPKNSNGKVNLHQLREQAKELGSVGFANLMAGTEDDSVMDQIEGKLAQVWARLLDIEVSSVRPSHVFTDLGGSSIQAIQVVSELRNAGLTVELSDLLIDKTLRAIAAESKAFDPEGQQDLEPFALIADQGFLSDLKQDGDVIDAYPATPFQEAMLASINTPSDPYTYSRTWDVSHLDVGNLRQSFDEVFRAREILRTVFVPHRRSFIQAVRSDVLLPWHESSESLEEYSSRIKDLQWDLSSPLWKAAILANRVLVVTMHHSLFDFWSHRFLYDDVAYVYNSGQPVPERPGFRNFVRYLQQGDAAASETFWSAYLEGADAVKLNHSPTAETSRRELDLGFSLSERASSVGFTLGTVIYAAWAILLSRQLGSEDVTFATTISGREVPVDGIHAIDGPTMTTVPQRVKVSPETRLGELAQNTVLGFARLLRHSQAGMLGALRASKLSPKAIDTLVNILVLGSDSRQFRQPEAKEILQMHGSRPQWASGSDTTVLAVEETTGSANTTTIRLISAMEPRRLEFLESSFVTIVNQILEQPALAVSSVAVMGDDEREFLYNTLSNRKTLHVPDAEFLHNAFERHASNSPERVAIDFNGSEQVSYAILNNLANRFAHELIDRGLQPGDLVPLVLDKSVDMIVAILGVLKAGGAYVPLSPDNPTERNAFVVSDTKAKLLVLHPQYAAFGEHAREHLGVEIFVLDNYNSLSDFAIGSRDASVAPTVATTPDSLAYLIYTSGSTGLPKGVKVPHRAAAAAVVSMAEVEGRHQGTWRTLQFANYVFDASVQDFFNTLSTGGTLCMAPTDVLLSDIAGCINRMDARQSIITPTVAKLFSPNDVPRFETLIVGGELLTSDVVDVWGPRCKILNVYGPTETSMVVTTKAVEWSPEQDSRRIGNIGAPFPTVMAFIVHPDGEALQPYGAVGELCIGGPQVTDGYMNRPDLTGAAYIDSHVLGTRIYRTGDLARWLPGGEIECLGRKDNQVKIHGHRIELGEVEESIRRSGLVKDTVATVASVHGKVHLVAFCVFDEGIATVDESGAQDPSALRSTIDELRGSLGSLATYMVPKFVIPMSTFPKLPSRKVDRKTLKKVVDDLPHDFMAQCVLKSSDASHEVVPVETPAEEVLQSIWADVFDVSPERLGREASFFALGGDSISAISLTGHLRRAGYSLTVLDILKSPKLKDLAASMRKIELSSSAPKKVFEAPGIVRESLERTGLQWDEDVDYVYPCPPGQAEFLKQGSRDTQMWVLQTVRRMPADVHPDAWIEATTKLTEANDILRTCWLQVFPEDWVGVVLRSSQLRLERPKLDSEQEISRFIERFWEDRFEFGRPFIKYAVINHNDSSWDLVIKMDHAVYDGTLLRVFDDHFGALLRNEPLPPRVEFRDFAQHVFQEDKNSSLEYWKMSMVGVDARDQIIHGIDLASVASPKITASLRKEIDTADIDRTASHFGVTPSIIFQAAFSLWLAGATDSTDIRFDYLLSGRNVALPDPQSINGTLANFLPFRTALEPKESVTSFVSRLQDDFWAVTENGLVGLDEIYRTAGLSRETHSNRVLFLSQPFEPTAGDDPNGQYRWLVMAKSKVRMFQPYALVVEVSKSLGERHVLKVMYDEGLFDAAAAEKITDDISALAKVLMDKRTGGVLLEEL